MSSELTVELATWAMSLERAKATVASDNIANANITGKTKSVNFDQLIGQVEQAIKSGNQQEATRLMQKAYEVNVTKSDSLFDGVALDKEVADLSAAKGRYKVIAESLSKKFGLMSIATKGR